MLPETDSVRSASPADALAARPTTAEIVALLAVGWPFATLILTTVLYWAGIPIGRYHLWAGLLLILGIGHQLAGNGRVWLTASFWLAIVTLSGGAALEWLYDFSGDGQWYHLPGILALAQGWNPFQTPGIADWNPAFAQMLISRDINYPSQVYVQHYPKGTWIIAAAAYRGTGLLEAAKVVNLLYILAVYLLTLRLIGRLGYSRLWRHALALAAAANPVALYQVPSFFVDGQLASLCTLLLVSWLDYLRQPRLQSLLLLGGSITLLVGVKFTGPVFAVGLVGTLGLLGWIGGRRASAKRWVSMGAFSLVLAVLLTGYQPYVTNLVQQGHPFYPALGREDPRNLQWHSAPAEFMEMNRIEKLTRSVFARSSGAESMPQSKIPFTTSKRELYIFFNTEPRYGGFGPFFGGVLVLSIVVFSLAKGVIPRETWRVAAGVAVVLLLSALLNPEAWWARLSPQLWLVPLVMVAAAGAATSNWPRIAAAILLCFVLGNSMVVTALNWGRAVEKNFTFREQLSGLQRLASAGPIEVKFHRSFRMLTELRLSDRAIPYRQVERLTCTTPIRFSFPADAQAEACPSPSQ